MINKKISTIAGSLIILAIVTALGFSFLASNKKEGTQNQNNVVLDNSELGNKEAIKQEDAQKENEENSNLKISDRWTVVNHENFWNNPNLFAHKNYSFPNIEFSYPENWEFGCCNDMDYASTHIIYSSKYNDTSLPYIRITDIALSGCPDSKNACSIDTTVKLTADEKFNRLKSIVPSDKVLPEKVLKKLNTKAFVFKKIEKEGNFSMAYLINLKDDVIQIDFVNYELLDENFIDNFLDHISLESK